MSGERTRAIHVYGPIHDDYGQLLMWGCVEDAERWPCRRLMELGGHTAIPRSGTYNKEGDTT